MTEQNQHQATADNSSDSDSKKLSDEAIGLILLFSAIPLIAYSKWVYDDNVLLGAVASAMLAAGAIMLRKKFG